MIGVYNNVIIERVRKSKIVSELKKMGAVAIDIKYVPMAFKYSMRYRLDSYRVNYILNGKSMERQAVCDGFLRIKWLC